MVILANIFFQLFTLTFIYFLVRRENSIVREFIMKK